MRQRVSWMLVFLALPALGYGGCSKAVDPWKDVKEGPPRVLTSFPPLYCFAKNVAGPDAGVLCMLDTTGPHDFAPTPYDSHKASKADLVLANGLGLDNFIYPVVNSSGIKKDKVVEIAKGMDKKILIRMEQGPEHAGHVHDSEFDPHIWLGIPQAVNMVELISQKLQEIDAKNKEGYARREKAYIQQLRDLEKEGLKALEGKKNRKIITQHDSLGYFAKSFNLEIVGSIQIQGIEAEITKMRDLEKLIKDKGVRLIAKEPQYSPEKAKDLQKLLQKQNIQVEIATVDPMETALPGELTETFYITKMRENIAELAKKLP